MLQLWLFRCDARKRVFFIIIVFLLFAFGDWAFGILYDTLCFLVGIDG